MSLAALPNQPATSNGVPLLENGAACASRSSTDATGAHPGKAKIELIGGVVYVASPVSRLHSLYQEELGYLLGTYRRATPRTELDTTPRSSWARRTNRGRTSHSGSRRNTAAAPP